MSNSDLVSNSTLNQQKILEAGSGLLASAESLACRECTRREAAAGSRAGGVGPGPEISTPELVHNFSI